ANPPSSPDRCGEPHRGGFASSLKPLCRALPAVRRGPLAYRRGPLAGHRVWPVPRPTSPAFPRPALVVLLADLVGRQSCPATRRGRQASFRFPFEASQVDRGGPSFCAPDPECPTQRGSVCRRASPALLRAFPAVRRVPPAGGPALLEERKELWRAAPWRGP